MIAAILATFVITWFVLRSATLVQRTLRQSGLALAVRVMGLILAAVSIQFIADGGRELLARG